MEGSYRLIKDLDLPSLHNVGEVRETYLASRIASSSSNTAGNTACLLDSSEGCWLAGSSCVDLLVVIPILCRIDSFRTSEEGFYRIDAVTHIYFTTHFSKSSARLPRPWGDNTFLLQYDAVLEISAKDLALGRGPATCRGGICV